MYRPKVAICPHQEDYCDTCAKKKVEIRAKQTTINHMKAAVTSTLTVWNQFPVNIVEKWNTFPAHLLYGPNFQ